MPDRDWSAATPAVREAELLSLAQSTMRNALQLGLFENPLTKAQIAHNAQVLALSTGLLRRHAPRPQQRDPTFAAEDALRGQAEQVLVAIRQGALRATKLLPPLSRVKPAIFRPISSSKAAWPRSTPSAR
jgi:hypothetical protein